MMMSTHLVPQCCLPQEGLSKITNHIDSYLFFGFESLDLGRFAFGMYTYTFVVIQAPTMKCIRSQVRGVLERLKASNRGGFRVAFHLYGTEYTRLTDFNSIKDYISELNDINFTLSGFSVANPGRRTFLVELYCFFS